MNIDEDTTSEGYGRIEVKMNGEWQTICDDGFTENSAIVICAHLGYSAGEVRRLNYLICQNNLHMLCIHFEDLPS